MPFHRSTPPPEPEPDDDELNLAAHNQFQITLIGLNRFMREAARRAELDARLDRYLEHHPRPEEEAP